MMLLLQAFWKPLAGIALAVALFFAWQAHEATVEQRGYDKGHADGMLEGFAAGKLKGYANAITERQSADDAKLAAATTKARAAELAMQEEFAQQSVKRQQEKVAYENTIDDLRAAARRGDSGMRLPAGSCPDRGARVLVGAAGKSSGAAGRTGGQEGYRLLPETAESVLDAASDLRQDVLDRNRLIDLYNKMRDACNAAP